MNSYSGNGDSGKGGKRGRLMWLLFLGIAASLTIGSCASLPNFRWIKESIVVIESEGLGAGIAITKDGYILTNNHVVSNGPMTVHYFYGPKVRTTPGRFVYGWPEGDIAVVKVEVPLYPARFGDSDTIKVGDTVYTYGHPYGIAWSCTKGIVSAIRYTEIGQKIFQHDAMIGPGNSGGILANEAGNVIGINFAGEAMRMGLFHQPIMLGVNYALSGNLAYNAAMLVINIDRELECGKELLER